MCISVDGIWSLSLFFEPVDASEISMIVVNDTVCSLRDKYV